MIDHRRINIIHRFHRLLRLNKNFLLRICDICVICGFNVSVVLLIRG